MPSTNVMEVFQKEKTPKVIASIRGIQSRTRVPEASAGTILGDSLSGKKNAWRTMEGDGVRFKFFGHGRIDRRNHCEAEGENRRFDVELSAYV